MFENPSPQIGADASVDGKSNAFMVAAEVEPVPEKLVIFAFTLFVLPAIVSFPIS